MRSRQELEEFTSAEAVAHVQFCSITSDHPSDHGEEHRHTSEAQMRERIKGMSTDELVDLLARSALVGEAVKT